MERRRSRRLPQHPLVLGVDGHVDTREMYDEALKFFEFQIETVDDVADAYARARETQPDVIVTEIPFSTDSGWTIALRQVLTIQAHERSANATSPREELNGH
jgi:CheY-like chemotaxis protein